MTARDELASHVGYELGETHPVFDALLMAVCAEAIRTVTPEVLRAGQAGALTAVLAAIEDPARRQRTAAHFNMGSGLGWETARDIVRLMLDPSIPPAPADPAYTMTRGEPGPAAQATAARLRGFFGGGK